MDKYFLVNAKHIIEITKFVANVLIPQNLHQKFRDECERAAIELHLDYDEITERMNRSGHTNEEYLQVALMAKEKISKEISILIS